MSATARAGRGPEATTAARAARPTAQRSAAGATRRSVAGTASGPPAGARRHPTPQAIPAPETSPSPPARQPPPAPARFTYTTRAAVLGLTVIAVLLTLAYPLREYLAQRGQIHAAEASQRSNQAQIKALTLAHAAATDPAQIKAQARARLHYTLPGQRNYIVLVASAPAKAPVVKHGNVSVPTDPSSTWYGRLLDSDTAAGATTGGHAAAK